MRELSVGTLAVCQYYLEGKMTKCPFTAKGNRAIETLELIHEMYVDASSDTYEYLVILYDNYSKYGHVYLMLRKSGILRKFKDFKALAEKQLGKSLKTLRSDRDGEYLDFEFKDFHRENGIQFQLTTFETT